MKKLSLLYVAAFAALAIFTTSCGSDEEEILTPVSVDSCATAVYPESTGDAELEVLNYPSSTIMVEAETDLSLALQVTRGTSRAQKIRLFDRRNAITTIYF